MRTAVVRILPYGETMSGTGLKTGEVQVVSAAEAGWAAVESVMTMEASSRNCWCQFHILENMAAKQMTRESRRILLKEQVTKLDPPRGLVALSRDQPVGWGGVEPRPRLRHVVASRLVAKNSLFPLDDPDVWVIYCILVPPAYRRQGLGRRLLAAAINHAGHQRARAIEGLPIDTSRRDGKLPPGFSTGTLGMFERQGFARVAALPSGRTLVYKTLPG